MQKPKLRVSLSVINFKEKALKTWGLEEWQGIDDPVKYVLFFGMYTLHDYDAYWYFEGDRIVFWCGSDILNTLNSPEFQRRLRLFPNAEHYCETEVEAENLRKLGIKPKIVPSFLEDVNDFDFNLSWEGEKHLWMCAHSGREEEYGVDLFLKMARKFPQMRFHIYGIYDWVGMEKTDNVIYHGQVSNTQLNEEISKFHCGFRGNEHEGFSEVPIKAILCGGYAITHIPFEKMWQFHNEEELEHLMTELENKKEMNKEGYKYWKNQLNRFPWCE